MRWLLVFLFGIDISEVTCETPTIQCFEDGYRRSDRDILPERDVVTKVYRAGNMLLETDVPYSECWPCRYQVMFRRNNKAHCDCENLEPRKDCLAFYEAGFKKSGSYFIIINGKSRKLEKTLVYCDQETDGGGWIVIQKRIDGKTNFYRNWNSYKNGFGDSGIEYWLGNDNIHRISTTLEEGAEMRIDLESWRGKKMFAKYRSFKVEDESKGYSLHVSGFSGNASDRLSYHNSHKFSTYDCDNDAFDGSCAKAFAGAWWYKRCFRSNLNGKHGEYRPERTLLMWLPYRVRAVEMKIRNANGIFG